MGWLPVRGVRDTPRMGDEMSRVDADDRERKLAALAATEALGGTSGDDQREADQLLRDGRAAIGRGRRDG